MICDKRQEDGEVSVRLFMQHAATGVLVYSSFSQMWGILVDIISAWATDLLAGHAAISSKGSTEGKRSVRCPRRDHPLIPNCVQ